MSTISTQEQTYTDHQMSTMFAGFNHPGGETAPKLRRDPSATAASFRSPADLLFEASVSAAGDGSVPSGAAGEDVGIASSTYFEWTASTSTTFSAFLESAEIMQLITLNE